MSEPDTELDTRGLLCPLPVLRAQQAMSRLERGNLLALLADDEGILADLPPWCEGNGHELVAMHRVESPRTHWRCLVRKGR